MMATSHSDDQQPQDSLDLTELRASIQANAPRPRPGFMSRLLREFLIIVALGFVMSITGVTSYIATALLNPELPNPTTVRVFFVMSILFPISAISYVAYSTLKTRTSSMQQLRHANAQVRAVVPDVLPARWLDFFPPTRVSEFALLIVLVIFFAALLYPEPQINIALLAGIIVLILIGRILWRYIAAYRSVDAAQRSVVAMLALGELVSHVWLISVSFFIVWQQWWVVIMLLVAMWVYIFIVRFIHTRLQKAIFRALPHGNYDAALQQALFAQKLFPNYGIYRFLEAAVYLTLGQSTKAEKIHTQLIHDPDTGADLLGYLMGEMGEALTERGHYADALPYLEAAIRIVPMNPVLYTALVDWYLEQRINPERALDIMDFALELTQPPQQEAQQVGWSYIQLKHAQIAALTGRDARVDAALAKAKEFIKPQLKRELARLHCGMGFIAEVRGDVKNARQDYQRAIELDPQGYFARAGRRALARLESPRAANW